jgi:hypothetical protein
LASKYNERTVYVEKRREKNRRVSCGCKVFLNGARGSMKKISQQLENQKETKKIRNSAGQSGERDLE